MEKHGPVTPPLIACFLEHAAFVRLTGVIGQDGKTAYHKISRGMNAVSDCPSLAKDSGTRAGRKKAASLATGSDGAKECSSASIDAPLST